MNAMLIHPAGIVLRKTFLSCGNFPVSHHLYIVTRQPPVAEDRLGQSSIVFCESIKNR
jgi:hypothetical protein